MRTPRKPPLHMHQFVATPPCDVWQVCACPSKAPHPQQTESTPNARVPGARARARARTCLHVHASTLPYPILAHTRAHPHTLSLRYVFLVLFEHTRTPAHACAHTPMV